MPGPAATIGSQHTCPLCNPGTPPPPHVGGPVIGPGAASVLIENKPAAVVGDTCMCQGPPDTIIKGEPTVLIEGKPAATVGPCTAHTGIITTGATTVIIGSNPPKDNPACHIMPLEEIPFPDTSVKMLVYSSFSGKRKELKQNNANQKALREEALPTGSLNDFDSSL